MSKIAKEEKPDFDCRFQKYGGKKRFFVKLNGFPEIVVAAPDDNSAIVAAAEFKGLKWTQYAVYAFATVRKKK